MPKQRMALRVFFFKFRIMISIVRSVFLFKFDLQNALHIPPSQAHNDFAGLAQAFAMFPLPWYRPLPPFWCLLLLFAADQISLLGCAFSVEGSVWLSAGSW